MEEAQPREHFPDEPIGIYAGGANSGILLAGQFKACPRDDIKARVKHGEIRLLIGTDAASTGLNLQRLGCLINLDLPWNPTLLEQRKGRVQRGTIRLCSAGSQNPSVPPVSGGGTRVSAVAPRALMPEPEFAELAESAAAKLTAALDTASHGTTGS